MYEMKSLGKLKRLDENAPEAMKAFWSFDKAVFAPGAVDVLHKQLMAVAAAMRAGAAITHATHLFKD